MNDEQLQQLLGGLQGIADRLALEGRFVDAALVAGSIQALRALRTALEPPKEPPKPPLELVPQEAKGP
jgi:hypothetical protein